jgi:hypothetical protein
MASIREPSAPPVNSPVSNISIRTANISSRSGLPVAEGTLMQQVPVPNGFKFHAFLTHTWVKDSLGRPNHARVKRVFEGLRSLGLTSWFDDEKMQDDVVQQMIGGIDESACIVVFVTEAYMQKVGSGNRADNCFKEFDYAYRKKPNQMIAVPMEPSCLNPNDWTGRINMALGGLLYKAKFSDDDEISFNENIRVLFNEILRKSGQSEYGNIQQVVSAPPISPRSSSTNEEDLRASIEAEMRERLTKEFEENMRIQKLQNKKLSSSSSNSIKEKVYDGGHKYVGEFINDGERHGQGTYTWVSGQSAGNKYVGEWRKGKKHGHGTYSWSDGGKYVGEYVDDKKHGQGAMTWANGDTYCGGYVKGIQHGYGISTYPNGNRYVGDYKDGQLHKGTYEWSNGNKYVGEWKNAKKHGKGTFTWKKGDIYIGEYKDGKQHGQGESIYADGNKFVGSYKNGELHHGLYTWKNGDTYTGGVRI